MSLPALGLLAIAFCAPAQAQDSASEIVARLAEQARAQSCTVTYRLTSKDGESRLRVIFQAPDALKIELQSEGNLMQAWTLADRWVVQAPIQPEGFAIDFDPSKVGVDAHFDETLERQFPAVGPANRLLESGCFLSLRVHPDKPFVADKYIEFRLSWTTARAHPFEWFAQPKEWNEARIEPQRLLIEYASGARAVLSRAHGWPQELMHPAGSRLELVEFSTSVDEDEFLIPEPEPGLRDMTKEWVQNFARQVHMLQRGCAYLCASSAARNEQFEPAVLREHLAAVFEVIYLPLVQREFGQALVRSPAWVDQMAEWCEQRLKLIGDHPKLREEFDALVAQRRAELIQPLTKAIQGWVDSLPCFVNERCDPAFALEMLEVERATLLASFETTIGEPLRTLYDERLREVGAIQ
jgi:hypothetical protein